MSEFKVGDRVLVRQRAPGNIGEFLVGRLKGRSGRVDASPMAVTLWNLGSKPVLVYPVRFDGDDTGASGGTIPEVWLEPAGRAPGA